MTPERRAELLRKTSTYGTGLQHSELSELCAAADELATIRAALKGVLSRERCSAKCVEGRMSVFVGGNVHGECTTCHGAGTIDPIDGPETTLELVERVRDKLKEVVSIVRG